MCISHTKDALITQEKGGTTKLWYLTNSGYKLQNEINIEHIGFCKHQTVPTKDFLISPKGDKTINILGTDNLEVRQSITPDDTSKLGTLMCLKHIDISDQSYVLAGYESGDFLIWDLRNNKFLDGIKMDESPMTIDYNPISNRGLCGGPTDKINIFNFNRNTMEMIQKPDISVKNAGISCIKIRNDMKVFASGGWDGRIRIFSWKSMRPLAVLTEHKTNIMDIVYSDDKVSMWKSPIMAAASVDGLISLWNIYN